MGGPRVSAASGVLRRGLACGALLALLACGGPRPSADSGEIRLAFWNGFTGPGTRYIEELVAEFNAANRGRIRVDMSVMLWSDYYVKLPLSLKGRTPPDCGAAHVPETAEFARAGMLLPIGSYLEDFDYQDLFPQAWEPGAVDGVRYGLPMALNPLVLFYNKRLFAEAGLDPGRPPQDRAEFLAYAKALTRDLDGDGRADRWGILIPLGWPTHYTYYSIARGNGSEIVSPDGRCCLLGEEPGLEAARFLYDLIHTHRVSPTNVEIDADAEGFATGKSAMEINGLWMLPQFQDALGDDVDCVILPQLGTRRRVAWCSSENLVVFDHRYASEERTRACVEFFRFLSARSLKWAQVGTLPARRSLYDRPEMQALGPIMAVYRDAAYGELTFRSTHVEESLGPVIEGLLKALRGRGDPHIEVGRGAAMATRLLQQDLD